MEKEFDNYIVLNWKTGTIVKSLRKKPMNVKPYCMAVRLKLTVELPLNPEPVLEGKVKVPEATVTQMMSDVL